MTFTTPNGIRYPNDPNAFADIIQFFKEMAEDVDTKFIPKSGNTAMTGTLTARSFTSDNGGSSQSATVFQTGPSPSSAFIFYDDKQKIDGTDGRRLWIAGAHGTDVAIRTRSGAEDLNRISLKATTLDLTGAVTINGTLNVTGQKTTTYRVEANMTLAKQQSSWVAVPGAPGFTFVAPPSRAVSIGLGAMLPTYNTTSQITYRVRHGATLGAGTVIMDVHPPGWQNPTSQPPPHSIAANGVTSGGVQYVSVYTAFLLTSGTGLSQLVPLEAGETYNVVPYYINQNTQDLTMYRVYFIVTPDL